MVEGPNRGAVLRVSPERARLGRDAACELALPDEGVSRFHAELVLDRTAGWQLVDSGSKNGTYLDGVRVVDRHGIAHGNEVRLGTTVFLFLDEDEATVAMPALSETASLGAPTPAAVRPVPGARGGAVDARRVRGHAADRVARRALRAARLDRARDGRERRTRGARVA